MSAIGLKYLELEKGTSRKTIKAGQTIPVSPDARTGRHRPAVQHVRREDAHGDPAEHEQLRRRPRRSRARVSTTRSPTLRPLVTNAIPVLHNLASPATDLRGLFIALDRGPRRLRRWPTPAPTSAATRTRSSRPSPASRTSLEEATEGGPASLEQAIYSLPYEAPLHRKEHRVHAPAAPERECAATVAAPLGHAFAVGAVNLRAADRAEHAAGRVLAGAAEVRREPGRHARPRRLHADAQFGNPVSPGSRPSRPYCNYLTLAFRNVASLAVRERRRRHAHARRASCSSPTGPNNEGYPVIAARQRPVDRKRERRLQHDRRQQPRALQPLPERRRPGSAAGVRSGQRELRKGKAVIRQPARRERRQRTAN